MVGVGAAGAGAAVGVGGGGGLVGGGPDPTPHVIIIEAPTQPNTRPHSQIDRPWSPRSPEPASVCSRAPSSPAIYSCCRLLRCLSAGWWWFGGVGVWMSECATHASARRETRRRRLWLLVDTPAVDSDRPQRCGGSPVFGCGCESMRGGGISVSVSPAEAVL